MSSNIPSSWSISGASNFSGSGTSGSYANAIAGGSYAIGNIPTSITYSGTDYTLSSISPSSSQTLVCAGSITFTLTYSPTGGGPGPGGNTGTVRVNTNEPRACFQLYRGNGSTNPYGNAVCPNSTSYTYTNVPAPDNYQLEAFVYNGVTPTVTPVYQTLTVGNTITFNVYYGGGTTPPPGIPTGTISVAATLDGNPVNTTFALDYSYGGYSSGGTTVNPYTMTNQTVAAPSGPSPAYVGTYTATHRSGGPAGSTFQSITPSPSQTVNQGQNTTFTFNFTSATPRPYNMTYDVVFTRRPLNAATVTLDNSDCAEITVNWDYTPNGVEEYFTVWRTTNPTLDYEQVSGNLGRGVRSWTDNTVTVNESYYYKVRTHTSIGAWPEETVDSNEAGPIVVVDCVADIYFTYRQDLFEVNGAPYDTTMRIQDGDVITFALSFYNYGPEDASIQYICLATTPNLSNFNGLTSSSGSTSGISGPGGNCTTARLNVSGNQAANSPAWIVRYNATVNTAADATQELMTSTATLHYTDPGGSRTRSASFGRLLLFSTDNSRVPNFREVGP